MADTQQPTDTELEHETLAAPPDSGGSAGLDPEARQSPAWRIGKRVLGYGTLILFALIFLMPFALSVATSFKPRPEVFQNPLGLIPRDPTLRVYELLFTSQQARFPRWLFNSVVVATLVTLGRVFLDTLAGYALARLRFPGRWAVFGLVVGVLAVPGIVLAIPRFIVLGQLGLLDSYAGIILPLAVDAFGIFMMKQFFESIPREMEEAARIDGASIFQTWWRIIIPLAAPGIIALTILSFQGSWNEFLHPLIAAPGDPDLRVLPVGLALLRGAFGEAQDLPVLTGASILTVIPVAIVFLIFQRYFVQGVAASGVKG